MHNTSIPNSASRFGMNSATNVREVKQSFGVICDAMQFKVVFVKNKLLWPTALPNHLLQSKKERVSRQSKEIADGYHGPASCIRHDESTWSD